MPLGRRAGALIGRRARPTGGERSEPVRFAARGHFWTMLAAMRKTVPHRAPESPILSALLCAFHAMRQPVVIDRGRRGLGCGLRRGALAPFRWHVA